MIEITALLVVAAFGCSLFAARKRKFLRLEWPDQMSYYELANRAGRYFRLNGWRVHRVDYLPYQYLVSNTGCEFAVLYFPTEITVSSVAVLDASEIPGHHAKVLPLLISAEEVLPHIVSQGLGRAVYVMNYKRLANFVALNPKSNDIVRDFFSTATGD